MTNIPEYKYRVRKFTYYGGKVRFIVQEKENYYYTNISMNYKLLLIFFSFIIYPIYLFTVKWDEYSSHDELKDALICVNELRNEQNKDFVIKEETIDIWKKLKNDEL